MKISILITAIAVFLMFANLETKAQFAFSVSPGLQLNGASFGYKAQKAVPYIGLQVLSVGVNLIETGKEYNNTIGTFVSYTDNYKLTATIYIPTLGVKYFILEKNKLKAFGNASLSTFIPSANIKDSNDPLANVNLKEDIKDMNSISGQIGFGTEYNFDDNFSIGGEFGIRFLHFTYKYEDEFPMYDPYTNSTINATTTYDYKMNLVPTYVKVLLNYYF